MQVTVDRSILLNMELDVAPPQHIYVRPCQGQIYMSASIQRSQRSGHIRSVNTHMIYFPQTTTVYANCKHSNTDYYLSAVIVTPNVYFQIFCIYIQYDTCSA